MSLMRVCRPEFRSRHIRPLDQAGSQSNEAKTTPEPLARPFQHRARLMPDDQLTEVVITAPDGRLLVALTRPLVEQRRAACGHHMSIRSAYQGRPDLRTARGALHTRAEHFEAISVLSNAEHPYEVLCVVAVPRAYPSSSYHRWVLTATTSGTVGAS